MSNHSDILGRLNRNEQLSKEMFNDLLGLALQYKATEIGLSTGECIQACVDHKWGAITERAIETHEIEIIVGAIHGPEAKTVLSQGKDLDFSHQIGRGKKAKRFRINVTPAKAGNSMSLDLTCRLLDAAPPLMSTIDLTEDDFHACNKESGINLITGPTGSGKSTTMAAFLRRHIEGPEEQVEPIERRSFEFVGEKIVEYASPIEYVYHTIPRNYGYIVQSDVPKNVKTFAAAARNSMRRFAQIISLGETRDPETALQIPNIGSTGHKLYTSFHGNSCGDSLDRFNMLFPSADRDACSMNLLSVLNTIICQRLLPKKGGGVVALRERAYFNREFRTELMRLETHLWGDRINEHLRETKMDFATDAIRLADLGLISEEHVRCLTS